MKTLLAVLLLSAVVAGLNVPAPGNVLFCDICVDIVTDIDEVSSHLRLRAGFEGLIVEGSQQNKVGNPLVVNRCVL